MPRLDLHRDVFAQLGPVRHVQVGIQDGIPRLQQRHHGAHLRRLDLHVVTVEVQVLRGHAPTHFFRAALVGPVPGLEPLVAIDVEYGHEQHRGAREGTAADTTFEHFAQRDEARILAVDLARMDAALEQHDRSLARTHGLGVERAIGRRRQREQRPVFRCTAEFEAAHLRRPARGVSRAQPLDLVISAGAREAGLLGHAVHFCRNRRHRGSQGQGNSQGQEAGCKQSHAQRGFHARSLTGPRACVTARSRSCTAMRHSVHRWRRIMARPERAREVA